MSEIKEIEPNKKDSIVKGAYKKLTTYQAKGFDLRDQSADLKSWLEGQNEVEEVSAYGNTDITVKFKDKTQVTILLGRDKTYGASTDKCQKDFFKDGYSSSNVEDPHPVSKKAAVIDTLRDDWPPASTPDGIFSILKGAGYNVDYIKSDNANLQFFARFDDNEYGVVFIRSHGGMINVAGDDKLHIMVRPFFSSFPPSSGYNGIGIFTVGTNVLPQGFAYAYAFNNLFVQQYMNNRHFPNSLFHLLVCQSANPLAQDDMIKSFLDRGVGCYTGWTDTASSAYGDPSAVQFFTVLCESSANPINKVADAISIISSAGMSPDPDTGAVLVAHGSDNMQIIDYYMIRESSNITIYDPSGNLIRKGFHDILDAAEYSTNLIIGGKYSKIKITQSVYLEKEKL
jgi:hypothetical protein